MVERPKPGAPALYAGQLAGYRRGQQPAASLRRPQWQGSGETYEEVTADKAAKWGARPEDGETTKRYKGSKRRPLGTFAS